MFVTSRSVRTATKKTMKTHLERLIMLHLAMMAVSIGVTLLGSLWAIQQSPQQLLSGLQLTKTETVVTLFARLFSGSLLSYAANVVLTAVLSLGLTAGMIQMARGERVRGRVLLCRWKSTLGALGLPLWVSAKVFVWALPGVSVFLLGASLADSEALEGLGLLLFLSGLIAMLVMTIPAALRYVLAHWVYADDPELGVFDAVERSKKLMSGRKWQLTCLALPYVVFMSVIFAFCEWLDTLTVTALTVWPFLMAVIACAVAAFYLGLRLQVAVTHFYVTLAAPVEEKPGKQPMAQPTAPAEAQQPSEAQPQVQPQAQPAPLHEDATETAVPETAHPEDAEA